MKYILLSYLALYWVIWVHIVAHSYMYKKYGCKKDYVIKVRVPLYLFKSSPFADNKLSYDILSSGKNAIKEDKSLINGLDKRQKFIISVSGVVVNMICGIISSLAVLFIPMDNIIYITLLFMFSIFNFVQAAVTLIVNNIFISGDMVDIIAYNTKYKLLGFLVGIFNIMMVVILLINMPQDLLLQSIIWTCLFVIGLIVNCFMIKKQVKDN